MVIGEGITLPDDLLNNVMRGKQDLAAFIHLCGAGPATTFARRCFQMLAGERCGDHLVASYVSGVNAMKRQFLRLAADDDN
jgi:hypothetical protein